MTESTTPVQEPSEVDEVCGDPDCQCADGVDEDGYEYDDYDYDDRACSYPCEFCGEYDEDYDYDDEDEEVDN